VNAVEVGDVPLRQVAVRRSRLLNCLTIGWNLVEGVVAVVAGTVAGSVSLVAFGLDSGIEVSAALILTWRLAKERRGGCMADFDRRATRLIAISFAALAVYVAVKSTGDLAGGRPPEPSPVGIVLASLSLLVMPVLARAKRRLAPVLGSQAAASEANQTRLCAMISAVLLLGLGLNALFGWWWADPTAGLLIAGLAGAEGIRAWRSEALADTCCA
jgi:divalent metal cation (Fe/Co/Zn/Cd) transporter